MVGLGTGGHFLWKNISHNRELTKRLDSLKMQVESHKATLEVLEELESCRDLLASKVNIIELLKEGQEDIADRLESILITLPPEFTLKALDLEEYHVKLNGIFRTRSRVITFCRDIQETLKITNLKINHIDSHTFEIVMESEETRARQEWEMPPFEQAAQSKSLYPLLKEHTPLLAKATSKPKWRRGSRNIPNEIDKLRREIKKAEQKKDKLPQIREEIKAKKSVLTKLDLILPTKYDMDHLKQTLHHNAFTTNTELQSVNLISRARREIYEQVHLMIQAHGKTSNLHTFLRELTANRQIFRIHSLHLESQNTSPPGIVLMKMKASTYYYLNKRNR